MVATIDLNICTLRAHYRLIIVMGIMVVAPGKSSRRFMGIGVHRTETVSQIEFRVRMKNALLKH